MLDRPNSAFNDPRGGPVGNVGGEDKISPFREIHARKSHEGLELGFRSGYVYSHLRLHKCLLHLARLR